MLAVDSTTIAAIVQGIRELTLEDLQDAVSDLIPLELMPAATFFEALFPHERTEALKACLIIFILSGSKKVPRQFQLTASLASLAGRDSLVTSATGSGKTLCILIPLLLRPEQVSFLISPLKRLQSTQVMSRHSCFWLFGSQSYGTGEGV
jgi:ATP-dependent helicase YprA (DUF1998 family)